MEVKFLSYDALQSLCDSDLNTVRFRVAGRRRDRRTHIQILPATLLIAYHLKRARLRAAVLCPDFLSRTAAIGAIVQLNNTLNESAWMWWEHDFLKQRLIVFRVQSERLSGCSREMRNLLAAAVREAAAAGLHEVVVWDPPADMWDAAISLADDEKSGWSIAVHKEEAHLTPLARFQFGMDEDVVWHEKQYYFCMS